MNNMRNKILSLLVLLMTLATGTTRAYEAQIGEGESTSGYFPFYTLYNYSIAENLFLASELEAAGVEAGPITSFSWYATNAPGYEQQGISIWLANVSDEELTQTSHSTTNMTLVYTGSITPVLGWNEFVCNEETFEWDGTSNLLIYCQRNNGEWNSTVNWQATTSLSFTATTYRYQDSGPYDTTVGNTMYTSTTRPNIIIKGEGAPAFTEYEFEMPASDVTVEYVMARDLEYEVTTETSATSYHVIDRGKGYEYLYPETVSLTVTDNFDAENPVVLELGTDFTTKLEKLDGEDWVPVAKPVPGTLRFVIAGIGAYTGTIYTDPVVMREAYEVEVAAKSYITYYQKDNLTTEADEEYATIYTVASIEGDKAYLSDPLDAAPKETPLLIYNSSDDDQTFYLLSVDEPNLALTVAPEFMGTLAHKNMPGSDDETTYYVCNRHDFVRVDDAGTLYANRCWIEISNSNARTLQIVFSDLTGVKEVKEVREVNDGDFYDLNGRKVNQPKRKGVYINNGRKVIVK
jgi:hypothetical protein